MARKRPDLSYGNKDVVKEAFERKHGGKVAKRRLDRKAGGATGSPYAKDSSKSPYSSAKRG